MIVEEPDHGLLPDLLLVGLFEHPELRELVLQVRVTMVHQYL